MNTLLSPRKKSVSESPTGKERIKRLTDENEKLELELPNEGRPFNAVFFGVMVRLYR